MTPYEGFIQEYPGMPAPVPKLSPEVERLLDLQHRLGVSEGEAKAYSEMNGKLSKELRETKEHINKLTDRLDMQERQARDFRDQRDEAYSLVSELKTKLAKKKPKQTNKSKETK